MNASDDPTEKVVAKASISWKFVMTIELLVITTIAITVYLTYRGVFPFDDELGIYRILPGDTLMDFIWLYILSGFTGLVLFFITPNISRVLLRVHRSIRGKNARYYFQTIDHQVNGIGQLRRTLIPAFAALGIAYSISNIQTIANAIFVSEGFIAIEETQTIISSLSLLFILLLFACFILIVFTPIWLLQDSGLVCELEKKPGAISEIEGVGNWYLRMMKGFAGISTIVAYIFTVIQTIGWYQSALQSPPEGGFSVLILLVPVAAVAAAPLLALGPILLVFVAYEVSLRRSLPKLQGVEH
ncbi:MAG: hypothetical protein ACFFEF_04430 [Candidatus Thorarchaeota archaeon]